MVSLVVEFVVELLAVLLSVELLAVLLPVELLLVVLLSVELLSVELTVPLSITGTGNRDAMERHQPHFSLTHIHLSF